MSMVPEYMKAPFHQGLTKHGAETVSVPADVYGSIEKFAEECDLDLSSCELITGSWWARLSMPGYMDATEWSGPFESEDEARCDMSRAFDIDDATGEDLDDKRERLTAANSGYHDCPCRDCFEIAIGCDDDGNPDLCNACESASCDASGDSECSCEPEVDVIDDGDTDQ
jgi:hypothetical protein|nr:hypothetical protein [Kofleriaceae bacterium]